VSAAAVDSQAMDWPSFVQSGFCAAGGHGVVLMAWLGSLSSTGPPPVSTIAIGDGSAPGHAVLVVPMVRLRAFTDMMKRLRRVSNMRKPVGRVA